MQRPGHKCLVLSKIGDSRQEQSLGSQHKRANGQSSIVPPPLPQSIHPDRQLTNVNAAGLIRDDVRWPLSPKPYRPNQMTVQNSQVYYRTVFVSRGGAGGHLMMAARALRGGAETLKPSKQPRNTAETAATVQKQYFAEHTKKLSGSFWPRQGRRQR